LLAPAKGQPICMPHDSSPLVFSHLLRLEFPGSEAIRQLWRVAPPFVTAVFSRRGVLTREGRLLIRGKFRRLLICSVPPLARYLRAHYGLQGGCNSCGASCNLLFRCPHWDTDSRLCTVYESRPRVCRMFPITPTDLRDRDLVLPQTVCGFHFAAENKGIRPLLIRLEVKEQVLETSTGSEDLDKNTAACKCSNGRVKAPQLPLDLSAFLFQLL
jgi:hypothetical protein